MVGERGDVKGAGVVAAVTAVGGLETLDISILVFEKNVGYFVTSHLYFCHISISILIHIALHNT